MCSGCVHEIFGAYVMWLGVKTKFLSVFGRYKMISLEKTSSNIYAFFVLFAFLVFVNQEVYTKMFLVFVNHTFAKPNRTKEAFSFF